MLPEELQRHIAGAEAEAIKVGMSGSQVWRIGTEHYLKITPSGFIRAVRPEALRLEWLADKLPVPEIRYYGEDDQREYLLMSTLPGLIAFDRAFQDDVGTVVRLLAEGLRMFHDLPIADCPFDQRLDVTIAAAHQHMIDGEVDEDDIDMPWHGRPLRQIYNELVARRPSEEDLVFTHGDYCLPNILINPETMILSGFIDLGRAGIADRYQDIALCARSLIHNWGQHWVMPFYEAYGLDTVDVKKSLFYLMLDEFY